MSPNATQQVSVDYPTGPGMAGCSYATELMSAFPSELEWQKRTNATS